MVILISINPLDTMGISLYKQILMYNILTPSIIAIIILKDLWRLRAYIIYNYICPWLAKG